MSIGTACWLSPCDPDDEDERGIEEEAGRSFLSSKDESRVLRRCGEAEGESCIETCLSSVRRR